MDTMIEAIVIRRFDFGLDEAVDCISSRKSNLDHGFIII
jgi:hypothetical protein